MQVPYAEKWHNETVELRSIALDCGLSEECKWSKPCFTFLGKNVAIIIPLKESCAFSFFNGALLKDPGHLLTTIGRSQAGRWIKFTSVGEIAARRAKLRGLLREAMAVAKSGRKVELKRPAEYAVPGELQAVLDADLKLKAAFAALTPGRRKSYIYYISDAKQPQTRAARALKCAPRIRAGRGFLERSRGGRPDHQAG